MVIGDDPTLYELMTVSHPDFGGEASILRLQENGDCYALIDGRCTIYDKRPVVCRTFDCGSEYLKMSRKERRAAVAQKVHNREVLNAGRRITLLRNRQRQT